MRKFSLAIAALAGLFFGLAGTAGAATVTEDIGTLSASRTSAAYGYDAVTQPDFHLDGSGQGTFRVNFALGTDASKTATSITASAAFGTALKDFTFGLYNSANTLLKQVDQSTATYTSLGTTFSFIDFANLLKTGSYYLLLNVTAGNAGQLINGNISIAAVPIPATLPMFGAALVGLTILQLRRRRRDLSQDLT
jgi:hypothetical protein